MLICVLLFYFLTSSVLGSDNNNNDLPSSENLDPLPVTQSASSVTYESTEPSVSVTTEITQTNERSQSNANPIFQAFKNFLFQERSLTEDQHTATEVPDLPQPTETDHFVEMINSSVRGALTNLKGHIESVAPINSLIPSTETLLKNEKSTPVATDTAPLWDALRFGFLSGSTQKTSDVFSKATKSCSSCYTSLSQCVQKCFDDNNCRDVERRARKCPPVPTSFCNPFNSWSPADECVDESDCESPLLCCNDGCVNKCSEGVWK